MKLPLIKHISNFVSENDEDFIIETLEVLEHITEYSGIKDDEIDVLGGVKSQGTGFGPRLLIDFVCKEFVK